MRAWREGMKGTNCGEAQSHKTGSAKNERLVSFCGHLSLAVIRQAAWDDLSGRPGSKQLAFDRFEPAAEVGYSVLKLDDLGLEVLDLGPNGLGAVGPSRWRNRCCS